MSDDFMKAMEIQRRNFESSFGSLESMGYQDKLAQSADGLDSEPSENEFKGFDESSSESSGASDSEDGEGASLDEKRTTYLRKQTAAPKVVRLTTLVEPVVSSKADRKIARAGRVATIREQEEAERRASKMTKKQQETASKEDAENLENDLKLQRLLSESHILAHKMEHSGADLTLQTLNYDAPVGNARRRILDQRIRAAAATNSASHGQPRTLEKMPMSLRKGMIKARERRVAEYEKEAKEAGIVLSRVKKGELRDLDFGKGTTIASDRLGMGKKKPQRIRDRGLKIHSVGKSTRNGLRISQSEIDRINNMGKRRRR